MRRNKLSVILSIIIILFFFTTAATCNFCGIALDTGSSEESASQTKIEGAEKTDGTEGKDETEATSPSQQTQGNSSQQTNNSAPVIEKIEIAGMDAEIAKSEGYFDEMPTAVAEGAEMTITVNASDKNGDEIHYRSFDSMEADFEITLIDNNNAEITWVVPVVAGHYTLTIEASDEKDSMDSYSIDMNFVMSLEVIPEEASIIVLEDINSLAGFVESNGTAHQGNRVFIGDVGGNAYTMGYISFDISSLSDRVIDSAILKMSINAITGNPVAFSENLYGHNYNYDNDLNIEDLNNDGVYIGSASLAGRVAGGALDISNVYLKSSLQMAINNSEDKFQIKFRLSNVSNNDEIQDGIWLDSNNIKLEVTTE